MLNVTNCSGCPAPRSGMGHPRTPELIMHWFDVCTDPGAHKGTGGSAIATNPHAHRDQLVAVWIEQGATL